MDVARDKKPDMIVVLGDVFDAKARIPTVPLVMASKFLKSLQDVGKLYIIKGNHDALNDKEFLTDEHPFTAMKYWSNTTVIDVPLRVTHGDLNFIFVPYVEAGRFKEALQNVDLQNVACVFCHQEFRGAVMGPITSTHGDEWDHDAPYVISGHIHDYQQLQNNLLYLGTPIQHRYGDKADKVIGLLSINKPITNHNDCNMDLISLHIAVKKIIHLQPADIGKYKIPNDIKPQLVITGSDVDIKVLLKNAKIDKWRKSGVRIIFKQTHTIINPLTTLVDQHESFSSLLCQKIKQDQPLADLYEALFKS